MSTRLFAIIIGIDEYKSGSIWNLHSCIEDAKRMKRWLMDGLNVPRDQICLLLDSQATKQKIEDSFMEHLVNNPSIERGDAILVYFAGHGSCLPAPSDWYQGGSETPTVQVLCPYDHDTKSSEGRISGISDRSLHVLLDDLASSKGNNITVLLDCGFSPAPTVTNIRDRRITRWTTTIKAGPDDLYRDLWTGARGKPHFSKDGFFDPEISSHMLLAACPPGGKAVEDKEGGRFTISLLRAMSELPLHRTSYVQLVDHLRQAPEASQLYICLGKHKSRILFNDIPFATDRLFSSATLYPGTRLIKVEVGDIHGIVEGSEFSLHLHNRRCSRNPPIANAIVSEVRPTWCLARVKPQETQVPKSCWAKITRWNNRRPFRVYLKSTFTSFIRMWKLRRAVPTKPGTFSSGGLNILRVRQPNLADISLTVGRKRVAIVEHNPALSGHDRRLIKIDKASGTEVIDDAALFNLHLLRKNATSTLRDLVQMELYRLDPLSWAKIGVNHMHGGTATISYEEGAIYQVVLRNMSKVDLWPYLAYMDPNRYSITMLYHPDSAYKRPPLPSHGLLEIGSGKPGSEALSFALADHNHLNSGYLKLFLTSTPAEMSILEQDPFPHWLNYLESKVVPPSAATIPTWDTALASVVFIRHPDGNS